MIRKLLNLKREHALMRQALEWYASEDTWLRKKVSPDGQPLQWVKSKAANDRGDIARTAISGGEPASVKHLLLSLINRSKRDQVPRVITVPAPLEYSGTHQLVVAPVSSEDTE